MSSIEPFEILGDAWIELAPLRSPVTVDVFGPFVKTDDELVKSGLTVVDNVELMSGCVACGCKLVEFATTCGRFEWLETD